MKKIICIGLSLLLILSIFAGCDSAGASIYVVSRENGSGTRGAFIELFGIEQKNEAGEKIDYTSDRAEITSSTAVMIATIAGNRNAIGYISLGSLNDDVKALAIDGVPASVENIKNGSYTISRPFNIAVGAAPSALTQDFIAFILSDEGQAVVEDAGYITAGSTGAFAGVLPSGSITIAGSSSVTPVMEKLKEAYLLVNPEAQIEIQQTDSSSGINAVIEGLCDIGMASRELKDSERSQGLTPTVIALDGIAVIVNNDNPCSNLTGTQVRDIFTGALADWNAIN